MLMWHLAMAPHWAQQLLISACGHAQHLSSVECRLGSQGAGGWPQWPASFSFPCCLASSCCRPGDQCSWGCRTM